MPTPTRKLKHVWLLSKVQGGDKTIIGCTGTFKAVYEIARFELAIAIPNQTERTAREWYRKHGECLLWDKQYFNQVEQAMWLPYGKYAVIEKITVLKV